MGLLLEYWMLVILYCTELLLRMPARLDMGPALQFTDQHCGQSMGPTGGSQSLVCKGRGPISTAIRLLATNQTA